MQLHSFLTTLTLGILISTSALAATDKGYQEAIFAGGCFWCMEGPYDKLDGVISTTSGYTDGQLKNPTYRQVSSGNTGHTEAVKIVYDPSKISYERLLEVFWVNIDPLTANAQFCDHGTQYRSGIYYLNDAQKSAAMASLKRVQERFKKPVATEIDLSLIHI